MKTLLILRGLPGAGKSTLAGALGGVICTADDYFESMGGFDPRMLGEAHSWCRNKASEAMRNGEPLVIVAITSTEEREFDSYLRYANEYGYMAHSVIVENRHGSRSVHCVPASKMAKMRDRFQVELG